MKVVWTEGAADDLEKIAEYIHKESPDAAQRVARAIYDRIMSLQSMPHRGRLRAEDSSLELVLPSLPYIVLYEIIDEGVFVKAIRHTSRSWML